MNRAIAAVTTAVLLATGAFAQAANNLSGNAVALLDSKCRSILKIPYRCANVGLNGNWGYWPAGGPGARWYDGGFNVNGHRYSCRAYVRNTSAPSGSVYC